ncbi:MAG: DUF4382 domain-containing protein [Calditrichia bacterium]|nr:DUF4382 domain-containing protein [Calditrichia bacterium]
MRHLLLSLFLLILVLAGCEKETTGVDADKQTGNLTILLTDAPASYDSVNITFAEVSAHLDSTWLNILIDTTTVNLLDWSNGNVMILGSEDVPAGKYTQIRIKIIDAEIGVNGQVFPLDVPSAAKTGLKFGPQFTINEGSTYEMVIDFDASRSIVTTGPPHIPTGYKLKPRIRVTSTAITGSISGVVLNPFEDPIAYAIHNGDTTTTTIVDTVTGSFMLAFLPEGMYNVSVVDTAIGFYSKDSINVTTGSNFDLGDISL